MKINNKYPSRQAIRPNFILTNPILYFLHCWRTERFKELIFRLIEIFIAASVLSFLLTIASLAFPELELKKYDAILLLTFFYVSIPSLGYIFNTSIYLR